MRPSSGSRVSGGSSPGGLPQEPQTLLRTLFPTSPSLEIFNQEQNGKSQHRKKISVRDREAVLLSPEKHA